MPEEVAGGGGHDAGSVFISIAGDDAPLFETIESLAGKLAQIPPAKIRIDFDYESLRSGNEYIDLTRTRISGINHWMQANPIRPMVDLSGVKELRESFRELQESSLNFRSNDLKLTPQIDALQAKKELAQLTIPRNVELNVILNTSEDLALNRLEDRQQTLKIKAETSEINEALRLIGELRAEASEPVIIKLNANLEKIDESTARLTQIKNSLRSGIDFKIGINDAALNAARGKLEDFQKLFTDTRSLHINIATTTIDESIAKIRSLSTELQALDGEFRSFDPVLRALEIDSSQIERAIAQLSQLKSELQGSENFSIAVSISNIQQIRNEIETLAEQIGEQRNIELLVDAGRVSEAIANIESLKDSLTSVELIVPHLAIDTSELEYANALIRQHRELLGQRYDLGQVNAPTLDTLRPEVDDSALYALNAHLDIKQEHVEKLNQFFESNPLEVRSLTDSIEQAVAIVEQLRAIASQPVLVQAQADFSQVEAAIGSINKLQQSVENARLKLEAQFQSEITAKIESNSVFRIEEGVERGLSTGEKIFRKAISDGIKDSKPLTGGLLGAPFRLIGAFGSSVFQGVAFQVGSKITKGFATATDSALEKLGKGIDKQINRLTQTATIGLARAGGYRSTRQFRQDFDTTIDSLTNLDPRRVGRTLKKAEDRLVDILESYVAENDPKAGQEKVKKAFFEIIEAPQKALVNTAGAAIRLGAQPFRIRKRVELSRTINEAENLVEEILASMSDEIKDQIKKAEGVTIATGGIDYQKGGENTYFSANLVRKLTPGNITIPVANSFSNDSSTLGNLYKARQSIFPGPEMPVDRLLQTSLELGRNLDAVQILAQILAVKKIAPEKPITVTGSSGGAALVEEVIGAVEKANIQNVKGIGLTLPGFDLTRTASTKNYQTIVGSYDPIAIGAFGSRYNDQSRYFQRALKSSPLPFDISGLLTPGRATTVVPGIGIGHHLADFLTNEIVQQKFTKTAGTNEIDRGFTGDRKAFEFLNKLYSESRAIPRTIGVILGNLEALKEVAKGEYSFIDPGNPDYRRDNDFAAMTKNFEGLNVPEPLKEEYNSFLKFLKEFKNELTSFYESGALSEGTIPQKLTDLAKEGQKFFEFRKGVYEPKYNPGYAIQAQSPKTLFRSFEPQKYSVFNQPPSLSPVDFNKPRTYNTNDISLSSLSLNKEINQLSNSELQQIQNHLQKKLNEAIAAETSGTPVIGGSSTIRSDLEKINLVIEQKTQDIPKLETKIDVQEKQLGLDLAIPKTEKLKQEIIPQIENQNKFQDFLDSFKTQSISVAKDIIVSGNIITRGTQNPETARQLELRFTGEGIPNRVPQKEPEPTIAQRTGNAIREFATNRLEEKVGRSPVATDYLNAAAKDIQSIAKRGNDIITYARTQSEESTRKSSFQFLSKSGVDEQTARSLSLVFSKSELSNLTKAYGELKKFSPDADIQQTLRQSILSDFPEEIRETLLKGLSTLTQNIQTQPKQNTPGIGGQADDKYQRKIDSAYDSILDTLRKQEKRIVRQQTPGIGAQLTAGTQAAAGRALVAVANNPIGRAVTTGYNRLERAETALIAQDPTKITAALKFILSNFVVPQVAFKAAGALLPGPAGVVAGGADAILSQLNKGIDGLTHAIVAGGLDDATSRIIIQAAESNAAPEAGLFSQLEHLVSRGIPGAIQNIEHAGTEMVANIAREGTEATAKIGARRFADSAAIDLAIAGGKQVFDRGIRDTVEVINSSLTPKTAAVQKTIGTTERLFTKPDVRPDYGLAEFRAENRSLRRDIRLSTRPEIAPALVQNPRLSKENPLSLISATERIGSVAKILKEEQERLSNVLVRQNPPLADTTDISKRINERLFAVDRVRRLQQAAQAEVKGDFGKEGVDFSQLNYQTDKLKKTEEGLRRAIISDINTLRDLAQQGDKTASALLQSLTASLPALENTANKLGKSFLEEFKNAIEQDRGKDSIVTPSTPLGREIKQVAPPQAVARAQAIQREVKTARTKFNSAVVQKSDTKALYEAAIQAAVLIDKIQNAKDELRQLASQAGKSGTFQEQQKITGYMGSIVKEAKDAQKFLTSLVREFEKNGKDIGYYINKGLASGLTAEESTISAEKLVGFLQSVIDEGFQISSPSKWAIKQGQFIDQGFAIGLDGADSPEAMRSLALEMQEAFKEEWGIRSPAEKGKLFGRNIDEGIAIGLSQLNSEKAAQEKAENIKKAFGAFPDPWEGSEIIPGATPTGDLLDKRLSNLKEIAQSEKNLFSENLKFIKLDSDRNQKISEKLALLKKEGEISRENTIIIPAKYLYQRDISLDTIEKQKNRRSNTLESSISRQPKPNTQSPQNIEPAIPKGAFFAPQTKTTELNSLKAQYGKVGFEIGQQFGSSVGKGINATTDFVVDAAESVFGKIPDEAKAGFSSIPEFLKGAFKGFKDQFESLKQSYPILDKIGGGIKSIAIAGLGLAGAALSFDALKNQVIASYESIKKLQSTQISIRFALGDAEKAKIQLGDVEKTALRLGTRLDEARTGFRGTVIQTRNTALAPQAQNIFEGGATASAALSLNAEQQSRLFTAFNQIAGKGTVQSEELKQQLAELGVSFGLAARAAGLTTSEFSKQLEQGAVLSQDFLPKFANQLKLELGTAAIAAGDSLQGLENKVANSAQVLQEKLGAAALPIATTGLKALGGILDFISKNIGTFSALLQGALILTLIQVSKALKTTLLDTVAANGGFKALLANMGGLIPAATKLLGVVSKLALQIGIITAAIGVFQTVADSFSGGDKYQEFNSVLEAGQKRLEALNAEQEKFRKGAGEFAGDAFKSLLKLDAKGFFGNAAKSFIEATGGDTKATLTDGLATQEQLDNQKILNRAREISGSAGLNNAFGVGTGLAAQIGRNAVVDPKIVQKSREELQTYKDILSAVPEEIKKQDPAIQTTIDQLDKLINKLAGTTSEYSNLIKAQKIYEDITKRQLEVDSAIAQRDIAKGRGDGRTTEFDAEIGNIRSQQQSASRSKAALEPIVEGQKRYIESQAFKQLESQDGTRDTARAFKEQYLQNLKELADAEKTLEEGRTQERIRQADRRAELLQREIDRQDRARQQLEAQSSKLVSSDRLGISRQTFDRTTTPVQNQVEEQKVAFIEAGLQEQTARQKLIDIQGQVVKAQKNLARINPNDEQQYQAALAQYENLKTQAIQAQSEVVNAQKSGFDALIQARQILEEQQRQEIDLTAKEAESSANRELKSIELLGNAQKRKFDRSISQLQNQSKAIDFLASRYDRVAKLSSKVGELGTARNQLSQARTEGAIAPLRDARSLAAQLRPERSEEEQKAEDAKKKSRLTKILDRIGVGTNEADIFRQQVALEEKLARIKETALNNEIIQSQVTLSIEAKKEEAAGRRAIVEARITEQQAKQAAIAAQIERSQAQNNIKRAEIGVTRAQQELAIAQQSNDPNKIREAQLGLTDAQLNLQSARDTLVGAQQAEQIAAEALPNAAMAVTDALYNFAATIESNKLSKEILGTQNAIKKEQFSTEEGSRRRALAIEGAEVGVEVGRSAPGSIAAQYQEEAFKKSEERRKARDLFQKSLRGETTIKTYAPGGSPVSDRNAIDIQGITISKAIANIPQPNMDVLKTEPFKMFDEAMKVAQAAFDLNPVVDVLSQLVKIEERLSGQILAIAQRPLVVNNDRETYYEVSDDPLRGLGIT